MTRQDKAQAKRERRAMRKDASAYARRNVVSRDSYVRTTASAGRKAARSVLQALTATFMGRLVRS